MLYGSDNGYVLSSPSKGTLQAQAQTNGRSLGWVDSIPIANGATGNQTITSATADTSVGYQVVLNPAGPPPTLVSITVSPNPATIFGVTGTQAFTALGTFSDSSQRDVSSLCTWASSNTSIATINGSGIASAVAIGGPVNITCTDP